MERLSQQERCLYSILKRFPVRSLTKYRLVCQRWKGLIETQLFTKVKSLEVDSFGLFSNGIVNVQFGDSFKNTARCKPGAYHFLSSVHFPNIVKLKFGTPIDVAPSEWHLAHYLAQWPNLTELELTLFVESNADEQTKVWPLINSMRSLKSLRLHFTMPFDDDDSPRGQQIVHWKMPKDMQVLSRLEVFSMEAYQFNAFPALANLDGSKLQKLSLTIIGNTGQFEQLFDALIHKGNSLAELSLEIACKSKTTIPKVNGLVGEKFHSLRSLMIEIIPMEKAYLSDLLTKLAKLPQLNELTMNPFDWNQFETLHIQHLSTLPKLTSVNKLALDNFDPQTVPANEHDQRPVKHFLGLFFPSMPTIFPSLVELNIEMDFQAWFDIQLRHFEQREVFMSQFVAKLIAHFPAIERLDFNSWTEL